MCTRIKLQLEIHLNDVVVHVSLEIVEFHFNFCPVTVHVADLKVNPTRIFFLWKRIDK